jgi:uncharacterized protein with PIN domain/sulfur carrier protein ThiS
LNDFLPVANRQAALGCTFRGTRSVKDLLEGLGVPHPEVDLALVNGDAVDLAHLVRDGDRVAAYPLFERLDLGGVPRLVPPQPAAPRFVADVHLGRLVAYLRLAGFDTDYDRSRTDAEIVGLAEADDRTVLTRDVGLLMHGRVSRGYFVRETQPGRQLVEVLRRFDLPARAAPFSRCLRCNGPLRPASPREVEPLLPGRTREVYASFWRCTACGRVYWQGSHYARMRTLLETAFAAAEGARP